MSSPKKRIKRTVGDCIGRNEEGYGYTAPKGVGRLIGIEVEVEQCRPVRIKNWKTTDDPSLRNAGCEYVSDPLTRTETRQALELFYAQMSKRTWSGNRRTGIHVHVDARDYSIGNIASLAAAYCLVEPALFNFVGKEREENIYCVPWYRADTDLVQLAELFRRNALTVKSLVSNIGMIACKYSAFYLEPLRRFGTVEFRHAPTWTNFDPTWRWVNFCWNLVEWASTRTGDAVLKAFHDTTPAQFAQHVLGPIPIPPGYNEYVERCDVEILAETLMDAVNADRKETPKSVKWKRTEIEGQPGRIPDELLDEPPEDEVANVRVGMGPGLDALRGAVRDMGVRNAQMQAEQMPPRPRPRRRPRRGDAGRVNPFAHLVEPPDNEF